MGQPNVYVPISADALKRKIELLHAHFGSQRSKQWFDSETFRGLARLRGMECRAIGALRGSVLCAETCADVGAPEKNEGYMTNHALYLDLLKKCLTGYIYPQSSNLELYAQPSWRPRATLRNMVIGAINKRGYKIFKVVPFDAKARENGTDWPSICYSMVGLKRLDNLQVCIEKVLKEGVPGDLIETGVWRGGSCILMRAVLKLHQISDRQVWVADSFEGLPTPSHDADKNYTDLSDDPYLKVSMEDVQSNFGRFGLLDEQVRFLKGWFKDTLEAAPIKQLAVLRLDGDLYESTMDVLKALYHKVSKGGFVIIDDYHSWQTCKRAVDEFRTQMGISNSIEEIDGMAVFWRKSA